MSTKIEFRIDWIALFLILVPTFYVVGIDVRESQANFFQFAVFAIIALIHVNRYISFFLLFSLFQYVAFPLLPISFEQLQNLFLGALAYHMIVQYADHKKLKFYLWLMLGFMAFNIFWSLLQAWNIDPIFVIRDSDKQPDGFRDYMGFFGIPAMLGNYCALVVPICLFLMPVTAGFAVIGLLLAKSTFSVLAAFSGASLFLWFKNRMLFWVFGVVSILTVSTYAIKSDMPSGQFARRFHAWQKILVEAFKTQWAGHGLGSLAKFYFFCEVTPTHNIRMTNDEVALMRFLKQEAKTQGNLDVQQLLSTIDEKKLSGSTVRINLFETITQNMQRFGMDLHYWKEAHNEFIQVFFEMGLAGFSLMLAYVVSMFRRFYRYGRDNPFCVTMASCFLAIVIISLGHFPFHVARLAAPFLVVAAFFELALLKSEGKYAAT